jgi:archaellum biogenesis ATPase FlaH
MKYLTQTTQLARYGFVKLADAAHYVATGNTTMVDYITKMNAAMEGGAADKWDKFAGRMKLVAADFFKKEEPTFNRILDDLSNWMD